MTAQRTSHNRAAIPILVGVLTIAVVVIPSAGLAQSNEPAPAIPLCEHDPTRWHPLVERAEDGSIICTYGHEHKDDPRVLDGLFGPLPFGEISYPWQTHNAVTGVAENDAKHRYYAWMVATDQPCLTGGLAPMSMDNIRLEVHSDGSPGAAVRFHSYLVQAELCDPQDPSYHGTISIGGHMDFGHLMVRTNAGDIHVPLPSDPTTLHNNIRRVHGSPEHSIPFSSWYGTNGIDEVRTPGLRLQVDAGVGAQDLGPVDPADPAKILFYGGSDDGTRQEPLHALAFNITRSLDALDGTVDGYVTYHGFTDRFGKLIDSCEPAGSDCVPLALDHVKVGYFQFRNDVHKLGYRNYGERGPNGEELVELPSAY